MACWPQSFLRRTRSGLGLLSCARQPNASVDTASPICASTFLWPAGKPLVQALQIEFSRHQAHIPSHTMDISCSTTAFGKDDVGRPRRTRPVDDRHLVCNFLSPGSSARPWEVRFGDCAKVLGGRTFITSYRSDAFVATRSFARSWSSRIGHERSVQVQLCIGLARHFR
jgi:hypothetical protein